MDRPEDPMPDTDYRVGSLYQYGSFGSMRRQLGTVSNAPLPAAHRLLLSRSMCTGSLIPCTSPIGTHPMLNDALLGICVVTQLRLLLRLYVCVREAHTRLYTPRYLVYVSIKTSPGVCNVRYIYTTPFALGITYPSSMTPARLCTRSTLHH
ncbi:hypothetical protein GY45DRAFT_1330754 [Cubamyces sp. BRFM 1775]|nr:hypothetical protein GY45DRAFT_1330754 [Cubamyces sp. BRFM 1775]